MRPKLLYWVSLLILNLAVVTTRAEVPDTNRLTPKQKWTIAGLSGTYVGGFAGLYQLWYADHNTGNFHFFNDNREWAQMDKVAHVYGAYAEAKYASRLMEWSGFKPAKAAIIGSAYSILFQSTVEVFDGFSEGWGASTGDIVANFTGTGLYLGQELLWDEQRILMKFSYLPTGYPQYRPDLLGKTWYTRIIKDYNGQTYWVSGNITSFLNEESTFPKWLNVAFGYSIDGFIAGNADDIPENFPKNLENFPRMRKFYLSADIDLERIEVRNKALKTVLSILNNFKFPLPAVGFSDSGKFAFQIIGF